jgi:DHA2 family methylenomycin A resistance protein-like MFS transporter
VRRGPSALTLIAARVVQGVGAAMVFPSSLALLAEEFEGPERRRAIGVWGAVIGLAFAIGRSSAACSSTRRAGARSSS